MEISNKEQEYHSPSEMLYKYLLNAELPKNKFLDELQEEYFTERVLEEYDEPDISKDQTTHELFEWNLYGDHLIEKISFDMELTDEGEMEVQSNNETFIGLIDYLGNGYGNNKANFLKINYAGVIL